MYVFCSFIFAQFAYNLLVSLPYKDGPQIFVGNPAFETGKAIFLIFASWHWFTGALQAQRDSSQHYLSLPFLTTSA